MYKNEAEFQTALLAHIKSKGGFGFKISDSDRRLKPADCVVTIDGETYWLELKHRSKTTHACVQPHQENSCKRIWAAGGKYYFIEYNALTNSIKILTGYMPMNVFGVTPESILKRMGLHDFVPVEA